MKGTQRRKELIEWLEQEKSLSLLQIVERFGISKMTAHRDLDMLEGRKALRRIHGGAVTLDKQTLAPAVDSGVQFRFRTGRVRGLLPSLQPTHALQLDLDQRRTADRLLSTLRGVGPPDAR